MNETKDVLERLCKTLYQFETTREVNVETLRKSINNVFESMDNLRNVKVSEELPLGMLAYVDESDDVAGYYEFLRKELQTQLEDLRQRNMHLSALNDMLQNNKFDD